MKNILIIGLGVLGGSFALGLKKFSPAKFVIWGADFPAVSEFALKNNIIDQGVSVEQDLAFRDFISSADIIVLATPVEDILSILEDKIFPYLNPKTIVTDVGSTKLSIMDRVAQSVVKHQFVGGHPIAGTETFGIQYARPDLFIGKNIVLIASANKEAFSAIRQLWESVGGNVGEMTAQEHDAIFSAVSHLPHLLAFTLVHNFSNRSNSNVLFQFAASGFRDFTRIAGSSPDMWRDIFQQNQFHILREIEEYQSSLTQVKQLIQEVSSADLYQFLAVASQRRRSWQGNSQPLQLFLPPIYKIGGVVSIPGSKSISNRILLLSALANGKTELINLLDSEDTQVLQSALQKLGIEIEHKPECFAVKGCGGSFSVHRVELFLGNAGTAFRPLTAVLALVGQGSYVLDGVPRMRERPIADLVTALRQLGANIHYLDQEGYPPLQIEPADLSRASNEVVTHVDVKGNVSSQFISAFLMAIPLIQAKSVHAIRLNVREKLISQPYVEMTCKLMSDFGVQVEQFWDKGLPSYQVSINHAYVSPKTFFIEADVSSASYFIAAGVIARESESFKIEGISRSSIQGDIKFIDVLIEMGADISFEDHALFVKPSKLRALTIDCDLFPDAAMTLAILALVADGTTELQNIGSWRVKETDRIIAMKTELEKLGASVQAGKDYLIITPPKALRQNVAIDTYDDHRMAMCFSLVSLMGVGVIINNPDCVRKTFPDYFERFARITTL